MPDAPTTVLRSYPQLAGYSSCQFWPDSGFSGAKVWRIGSGAAIWALKLWPSVGPNRATLAWIHGVLQFAAARGWRLAPLPLVDAAGNSVHVGSDGSCWDVTPWINGTVLAEGKAMPDHVRSAAMALAAYHLAVREHPDVEASALSPGLKLRLAEVESWQTIDLRGALLQLGRTTSATEEASAVLKHLAEVIPPLLPATAARLTKLTQVELFILPAIRDLWRPHLFYDETQVVGVIDFGALRLEHRATDLARLLGSLCDSRENLWKVGFQSYQHVWPLTSQEVEVYQAFVASQRVLAPLTWAQRLFPEILGRRAPRGRTAEGEPGDHFAKLSGVSRQRGWERIKTLAEQLLPESLGQYGLS